MNNQHVSPQSSSLFFKHLNQLLDGKCSRIPSVLHPTRNVDTPYCPTSARVDLVDGEHMLELQLT